jgi:Family of unknown function (DUF6236)
VSQAPTARRAPQIGLYYPHIHFKDDQWVKLAALYWDGIARIVPEHYNPRDSDVVRQFAANGFITSRSPSLSAVAAAGGPFLDLIRLRADELRERYALVQSPDGAETVDGRAVRTEILSPKLQFELDGALRDAGLAIRRHDDSGLESVWVHPRLAEAYMAALASEVAFRESYQTVSDGSIEHLAASGLAPERIAQILLELTPGGVPEREVQTAMAMFALRTVLPTNLDQVSVDKLMRFRQDHRDELTAFQEFVAAQAGPQGALYGLTGLEDAGALEAHVRVEYEKVLEPRLKDLRRDLRGIGIESAWSAINVRLPGEIPLSGALSAITVGLGLGTVALLNPLFSIATVGLMLLKVRRDANEHARSVVAAAPAAFLMFAQEEFTPKRLHKVLGREARRVAIGV